MSVAAELAPPGALGPREFARLAQMVHAASGIVLSEGKSQLVQSRLARRMRARGLGGLKDYLALIERDAGERDAAVYALTTNHTKFFREDHHFRHLADTAWPPLAKRLNAGGRVRAWSAACSSGEEPYTLLMTVLGSDRAAAAWLARADFRLLATDLSPDILARARAGRYADDAIAAVPPQLRKAWLRPVDGGGTVDEALRQLTAFRQLNLLEAWPMRGQFDVIFCRNVMIYFDEPTKARLQARLAAQLAPGGFLYIGHSERIVGEAAAILRPVGQTIYRKVNA